MCDSSLASVKTQMMQFENVYNIGHLINMIHYVILYLQSYGVFLPDNGCMKSVQNL